MVDYDNPWKEILEFYLKQFLELCLPELHVAIDWSIPPKVRDKELQLATERICTNDLWL